MSLRYRDNNGAETVLAGLTPGGNIETGAVATREGSFAIPALATQEGTTIAITFSEPLPDADYEVDIYFSVATTSNFTIYNKTASGFVMFIRNNANYGQSNLTGYYKAFKLYEVADAEQLYSELQDVQAVIPNNASSANKLTTAGDLSDVNTALDGRVADIEDVVPTTASITNKLVTQQDLDNATIEELGDIGDVDVSTVTDGQTIIWDDSNSKWVNGQGGKTYTAGDGINIDANDEISTDPDLVAFTFTGTQAQWNALTAAQKAKYNIANITDDVIGGEVADVVQDGLMSPVTSNAVYDALEPLRQNTNGQFILSNGLKICWGSETVTTGSTPSTSASFAYSGEKTISFPFSFTSKPTVVTNVESNPAFWSSSSKSVTVSGCTLSVAGDRATAGQTVGYIAIGY